VSSTKVKTFVVTFAVVGTLTYCICLFMNWPVFTYHPAVNRIEWGWGPGRSGEGPAMYWYGWTATTLIAGTVAGFLATLLPESAAKKIPPHPRPAATHLGGSLPHLGSKATVAPPVGRGEPGFETGLAVIAAAIVGATMGIERGQRISIDEPTPADAAWRVAVAACPDNDNVPPAIGHRSRCQRAGRRGDIRPQHKFVKNVAVCAGGL